MTAILRLGSMLMIFLVTGATVRDCCLPVTPAQPCHESKHDNETCSARQQAVAENKAAVTTPVQNQFYIAAYPNPTVLMEVRRLIHRAVAAPLTANDIYLRTGTLLI